MLTVVAAMSPEVARKVTKLSAPDGGWGYVITLATTVTLTASVVPMGAFGILFGKFLAQKGDGTTGVSLVVSIYVTVCFLMGIVANVLLKKYSFRKVALLGSAIHFLGALGTIFVESLGGLIFAYGIVKGIGLGLIIPTAFSSFNAYFDKKIMLMMSICQSVVSFMYMVAPYVANWCLEEYGFRGTLLLLAGLNLFCFPAAVALQPVKWHMKKETVENDEIGIQPEQGKDGRNGAEPLLSQNKGTNQRRKVVPGQIFSSLASIPNSVEGKRKNEPLWKSIAHFMDFHLFNDVKYMNLAIGLSLSFTADVSFYPIIPPIMTGMGFSSSDIALMISTLFMADFAARIILAVASAFRSFNSRSLFLVSSAFSGVLRTALFLSDGLGYKLVVLAALGFFRCFIQVPLTIVISDNYPNNFESAYSIYMMVCGVISLIIGLLMSYTKSVTHSDIWVYHLLTLAFFITTISWTIETLMASSKKSNLKEEIGGIELYAAPVQTNPNCPKMCLSHENSIKDCSTA